MKGQQHYYATILYKRKEFLRLFILVCTFDEHTFEIELTTKYLNHSKNAILEPVLIILHILLFGFKGFVGNLWLLWVIVGVDVVGVGVGVATVVGAGAVGAGILGAGVVGAELWEREM